MKRKFRYLFVPRSRLTHDQEMALGRRIQTGLTRLTDGAVHLTPDALEARNLLVEHNQPLAIRWAANRKNRDVDLDDLVQAAFLGLMNAATNYDPDHGTRFSTYAAKCMLRWTMRLLRRRHFIAVPEYFYYKHRTAEVRRFMQSPVSLDRPASPDQERSLGAFFSRVDSALYDPETKEQLAIEINRLDPRAARIIKARFGIEGDPMILEEVGRMIGITKERVRQIEKESLNLLRQAFDESSKARSKTVQKGAPC